MIKLITPKRDLYMYGDTSDPEGLCGKKGKFYEVRDVNSDYVIFTDERGSKHNYTFEVLDDAFWTVDFEKEFEFVSPTGKCIWCNYEVNKRSDWGKDGLPELAIEAILDGSWTITRFSNQTPPTPEEPSHPYENWKKDIGEAKFYRCIDNYGVLLMTVDNICGYLDEGNKLFYYHKNHRDQQTYLCCKVSYICADGWYFVRENKDSTLVKESSDVLASFKVPVEESINTAREDSSELEKSLCQELGQAALEEYFKNTKEDCKTLDDMFDNHQSSSEDVPESKGFMVSDLFWNSENPVQSGIDLMEHLVAGDEDFSEAVQNLSNHINKQTELEESPTAPITSDGGKSDYYKIALPQWLLDKQLKDGYIMLEDLTEVMFNNDFNYTNVFKAQKRMFELQQGKGKKGNTLEYDANKVKYYVDKQLEVFNRD